MALLEIQDLRVAYGKAEVLRGVDISLEEKDLGAVIGPNGVGKTTLMRAISGLTRGRGAICFAGRRIEHLPAHQIVKAGVILCPERRRLFPEMTVMRNLEMGAYLRTDRSGIRRDLDKILQRFPSLAGRRRVRAANLSGGEQQMLAVARALMSGPRLLMLDEPSFGLAPLVKREIIRILQEIQGEGITILLSEQDARLAFEAAHKIFVIENGRISIQGDREALQDNDHVREAYLGLA